MTNLTYDILAETLFSGEISGEPGGFAAQVDRLFETMGRVDPLDLLRAPEWLPRLTRLRGRKTMAYFRSIVADTIAMRSDRLKRAPDDVPEDFLTLLLQAEGPDGLTRGEIEDNIITFIGAGHETTARALGWTIYCLAEAPWEREPIEDEIDAVLAREPDPVKWLDAMPLTRAAFEEALRLYPPAPSINREPIEPEQWRDLYIPAKAAVLMMPWTIHRHRKLWDKPDAFMPSRFHPGNREKIDRYQYLPFGAGPRVCIGASFAMQEAIIALAVLMSRYRFDTTPETKPWPVQKLTTQPQGGLPMRVTPALDWRLFRHEGFTSPFSLMVIGWPKRSLELPAGTRIQPSLTQYSLTSVALLAVEHDADAALQRLGIVEGLRSSLLSLSGSVVIFVSLPQYRTARAR